jgi:hypothetical protein
MKIIVQDYTSTHSSESRLLYSELNTYDQIQAFFWSHEEKTSLYDMMDSINPDFIIVNAYAVNNDLVHYLAFNKVSTRIILKINDHIKNEELKLVENNDFTKKYVDLAICSRNDVKVKHVKMLPCVDTNVPPINLPRKIPLCIINETGSITPELLGNNKSFHIMSHSEKQHNHADISGASIQLCGLYKNYDKIIFDQIEDFEQPFFDALYRCDEVYFCSNNKELSEKSTRLFGQDLSINNTDVDFKIVQQRLEEKHMPRNRTKQLLSQMGIDQSIFTEVNK